MGVKALYASDLGRAMQTARPISEFLGLKAIPIPSLRERGLGILQGLTWAEVEAQFPQELAGYRTDPDYVVKGGESARDFQRRVVGGMEEMARSHPGQVVAAVTHGWVLDAFLRHVMSVPLEAPRPARLPNASVNIFDFSEGRWMLRLWGDISHLDHDTCY